MKHHPDDRLFVPLSRRPFEAFKSGDKQWELRRWGKQWTERNVRVARAVELRLGYSSGKSLWGSISQVELAARFEALVDRIDFHQIVPYASSRTEARALAQATLGSLDCALIAFRVQFASK